MDTIQTDVIKAEAINDFKEATADLLDNLFSIGKDQINAIPFNGSWTAAQLGEHLYQSYKGIPQLFRMPGRTSDRDPAAKKDMIAADFLNFNIKMKSPGFIVPELRTYDREELLNRLRSVIGNIVETSSNIDPTEECTAFALPVYGHLTRLEWIYFLIYHTQRHVHQLKKIREALESS